MQANVLIPGGSTFRSAVNSIKKINFINVLVKRINAGRIMEIKHIMKNAGFKDTDVVLDIGSGDGYWTNYFSQDCLKVIGVEPYEEHLQMAKKNYGSSCVFTKAVAENLNFESNCFNKIVSVCVFEHLVNDKRAFSEMHRVLKPSGKLVATVDSLNSIYIKASHRKSHMTSCYCSQLYTEESITEKLTAAGFKNIKAKYLMSSRLAVFYEMLSEKIGAFSFFILLPLYPIIMFSGNSKKSSGYKIFVSAEK